MLVQNKKTTNESLIYFCAENILKEKHCSKPFNLLLLCQGAENLDVCLPMTSALSNRGVLAMLRGI